MQWLENLYLSDSVKENEKELREGLEKGNFSQKLWVISIPICPKDQLDIRKANTLAYHDLWETIPMIVGMAGTKKEAIELVERITKDCLRSRGDALLREFLTGKGT